MEPRNPACSQEADAVRLGGRQKRNAVEGRTRGNESGVVEQGMCAQGSSEELGRPDDLHGQEAEGERPPEQAPGPESRRRLSATREARGRIPGQTTNRKEPHCGQDGRSRTTARRTGHQESELLNTTEEGGELNPGGPAGGKGEAGS